MKPNTPFMFERLIKKPLESRKSFFSLRPERDRQDHLVETPSPGALFINLLQSEFYNRLTANPGHLRELIPPVTGNGLLSMKYSVSLRC